MKKIVASIILVISTTINAQEGPKVVVFNSSTSEEKSTVERYNMFKISLLEPFSGDISFYYERVFTQNISGEIGLGFTIDDYLSLAFADAFESSDERTPLIGTSFGAGLRYYPFLAGDEFYFAPEFKYRYYHSTISTYETTSAPSVQLEESKSMSNFRITVGYVYLFDDRIFIDYFAGIGIAMIKTAEYNIEYDSVTGEYDYNLVEKRVPKPRLTLGIKFGLNF
jgi:hypothetical protein